MNEILRVMQDAIPKLKSTYGSTSRSSETFSNMLDRMVGQLKLEYTKLLETLKVNDLVGRKSKAKIVNNKKKELWKNSLII